MRLVEHLHVAEILREAEENRQRGLASGPEAAAPLSEANADLNLGDSGSFSTACAAVDVQTPAGMERTPGPSAHKGIGMSSFSRASLVVLISSRRYAIYLFSRHPPSQRRLARHRHHERDMHLCGYQLCRSQ